MEIQTQGSQTFNVPNNEEGRTFLKLMEKFRNKGWHYRIRGRGPRRDHGTQYHIPQQHSEWMAVYLRGEKPPRSCHHPEGPRYGFYDYDLP